MSQEQERAARRRALLREIEELRALHARLTPRRVRRARLERLHTMTRRSA